MSRWMKRTNGYSSSAVRYHPDMASTEVAQRDYYHSFTPEESSKGGRNAAVARRERIAEQIERRAVIDSIIETWETGEIGTTAVAAAQEILARLLGGLDGSEIRTSLDVERYARAADLLFKMHRLATGQSTSNAASLAVDATELAARREALLKQLAPLDPPAAPPA